MKKTKHMQKLIRIILIMLAIVLLLSSCVKGGKQQGEDDTKQSAPDPIDISSLEKVSKSDTVVSDAYVVGEMLTLTAVTRGADMLVDNSGMSGLKAPNHLHACFDTSGLLGQIQGKESMYYSDEKQELVFDIGSVEALGKLYIWNYNDTVNLDSGMQWIDLQYSIDGHSYKRLGAFALAQCTNKDNEAHGGNMATNTVEGNKPIDFGGIPGRYIKIIPLTNWGGKGYGLSEIRIFRQKATPTQGGMIFSEAWENNSDSPAYNLVNNTGMSDLGDSDKEAVCSNNPGDMWLTSEKNPSIIINLDGTYPISRMELWNYNDPKALNNGVKDIKVYYTVKRPFKVSTDKDGKEYCDFTGGTWTELGTYTLEQGTGKDGMTASLTIDFENIHAQHIKLVPQSNYGGDKTGLSEVRIYAGKGWAVEPSRRWTGLMSNSGAFRYQGNTSETPFAQSNNGSGWIGADGIISTPMDGIRAAGEINDDSKTLVTFQDSFIGNFGNYRKFDLTHGYGNSKGFNVGMKNMAYLFINGKDPDPRKVQWHLEMENGGSADHPLNNIINGQYWLGYSVMLDKYLYTIGGKFSGLTILGRDLLKTPVDDTGFPDMSAEAEVIIKDNAYRLGGVDYESIYQEGDYIYLYGRKSGRLVVCRILSSNFAEAKGYEFWDGNGWTDNYTKVKWISTYEPGNEFNVTYMKSGPYAGKYVNVYTEGSIWGDVAIGISDSVTGSFEKADNLYFATETYEVSMDSYKGSEVVYGQWNYNAKSQPALSADDELLITYHFGLHDDRVPAWGFFTAVAKEYEHPTFIRLIEIK